MKNLLLILFGSLILAACKKEKTETPAGTPLEIVVSNVVSPTVYSIKFVKDNTTTLNITGATENKTYQMPVSPGDGYSVTYSFKNGTANASGNISFNYNGINRGAVGAYGSGTTTVTIPK